MRGLRANLLEIEDTAVLIDRIGSVQDSALVARREAAKRAQERYDKKLHPSMVKEGDEILVFDGTFFKAYGRKFETRWKGPFIVEWVGTLGAIGYRVGTVVKTVSVDYVKPYFRRGDWHPKSARGHGGSKPVTDCKNTEEAIELSCFGGQAQRGDLTETFSDCVHEVSFGGWLFEKDRAAMDREIRGAPVKVGCVYVNASSVDLPVP